MSSLLDHHSQQNKNLAITKSSALSRQDQEDLNKYLTAARSTNTHKTYRSALLQFEKWGGRLPCDFNMLIQYALDQSRSLNPRSLDLHLVAIGQWHLHQGFDDPTRNLIFRKTLDGIRRVKGTQKRKAKALRPEHIQKIIQSIRGSGISAKNMRDQALILTGYFGAFRRSELTNIQLEDLAWEPEGLLINLPQSKTDQHKKGLTRALPFLKHEYCAAKAVRSWIEFAELKSGPLFTSINRWGHIKQNSINDSAVNQIIKSRAQACGLEFYQELSSHSLRRGFATSSAMADVDFALIKKQGGWKKRCHGVGIHR